MILGRAILGLTAVATLGGCKDEPVSLADALAPARGQIVDERGNDVSVDDLLAAAHDRPASVSFAYIGCGGQTPRMARLQKAAEGAAGGEALHIVLDAVDEPKRYPEVVRDILGADEDRADPKALRIVFIRKGERWPQETSGAIDGVMNAMGLRFGKDRHIETVTGIGLFDENGAFLGIRY